VSATAGWYPDPGGRSGLFRYWDGRAWSAATTEHPATAAPPGALGDPTTAGSQPLGRGQAYGGGYAPVQPIAPAPRRSAVGWILGAVALVVVIALVALGVRLISGSGTTTTDPPVGGPTGRDPSASASPEAQCPPQPSASPSPVPQSGARVTSGKLSYPRLGSPFVAPYADSRVPFGTHVATQTATVENAGTNKTKWAAAVVIATLTAGDGFYGPEQGAKLVARCITGTFYGDNAVTRKDTKSQATTVDGHQAWLIEAQLSYDIPDVRAKTELLLVLVVDTKDGNAGLFYGSVPDTAPTLVAPVRASLTALRVS
jgi:hypothetical protein